MASSLQLHKKLQQNTDRVLRSLGMPAILRRAEGDRRCYVVMSQFSAFERFSNPVLEPLDVKAMIGAKGVTPEPDNNNDRLITLDPSTRAETGTYRITQRPTPVAPAGVVMYWDCVVRKY